MSLSDKEKNRLDLYKHLLLFFEMSKKRNERVSGFCFAIIQSLGIDVYKPSDFKHYFPELYAKKPHQNVFWFSPNDIDSRIKLLKSVIDELEIKFYD